MRFANFLCSLIGLILICVQCVGSQSTELFEETKQYDHSKKFQWARASELQQVNTTKHENKIAAVFINVAYENTDTTTEHVPKKIKTYPTPSYIPSQETTSIANNNNEKNSKNISAQFPQDESKFGPIQPSRHVVHVDNEISTQSFEEKKSSNVSSSTESEVWVRVHEELGKAWPVHLYVFSSLFIFLSLMSVLCFIRDITNWKGIPSVKRIVLIISIIGVTTNRGLLLLVDPYGIKQVLPQALELSIFSSVVPCLTLGLSAFLSLFPERSCIKTFSIPNWILFVISGSLILSTIIIGVICYWIAYRQLLDIIQSTILASVAVWGLILCFCYVVLLARIERNAVQNQHKKNHAFYHKKVRIAMRYGAAAAFAQLFLSGLIVYSLVGPHEVPGSSSLFTWAWWFQHSLARLLEIILCACLLIASYMMSTDKMDLMRCPFGFLGLCCGTIHREVHPSVSSSRQALNVFTVSKSPTTADYVTADFQLVWGQAGNSQQTGPSTYTIHRTKMHEIPSKIQDGRRYCTLNPIKSKNQAISQEQVYSTIDEIEKPHGNSILVNEYNYCRTQPKMKTLNRPEKSKIHYWSPSLPLKPYMDSNSRTYVSLDEMSDANTISQNENQVDYLTDPSSSMDDGISTTSESLPGRWNPIHTLPNRGFSSFLPTVNYKENSCPTRASLK